MMKKLMSVLLSAALVVSSLVVSPVVKADAASIPSNANLLNTYGNVFNYVGNALVKDELLNSNILNMAAQEYNSITVGNEMKPDYVLGWNATTISVSQAKAQGLYIPSNYKESVVPVINYTDVDKMMKACYDKGLKMRGHTLVWHSQTPDWFFKTGFSRNGSYVDQQTMYAREEYFVKNYLTHCCTSPYASVIYAWDVVNEYIHAPSNASGYQKIFGNLSGRPAEYIKKAFQWAYEVLEQTRTTNQIHLFYNDFNTYMDVDKTIALVDYINQGKKICAGVGMQSHLSTDFPSVAYYNNALTSFCKKGYEVQITELDIGAPNEQVQASYTYDLFKAIIAAKKAGGNITAIVWWGMSDDTSWRSKDHPLLYATRGGRKKAAYNSVLQAYFDSGYTKVGYSGTPTNPQPSQTPDTGVMSGNDSMQCEDMTLSGTYAGKVSSPVNGVVFYANNDTASYTQQFGYDTHDFTLRGCSNNNNTAAVDLVIAGEKKGTFYFRGTTPTDVTLKNIKHATGNVKVELTVSTDDNTWDVYADYLKFTTSSSEATQTPTVAPTQAPTQEPQQPAVTGKIADGWYYIKGVGSQKYLQVENSSANAGANVVISSGNGNAGQVWKVTNTNDGYITLTSKLGNFMLDVANGSGEDGANVGIYNAYSGDAQKFVAKEVGNGVYTINTKSSNSQKVLDVEGRRTADGTNICQYRNNGQTNQQWQFEAVSGQTEQPTVAPTQAPTVAPTKQPTQQPTQQPTKEPVVDAGLTAEYTINSWGTGYVASIKIKNEGSSVSTWTLTIPKSELKIDAAWNVTLNEVGSNYVITPVSWNSSIPTGGSIEFGFQGSGSIGNTIKFSVK